MVKKFKPVDFCFNFVPSHTLFYFLSFSRSLLILTKSLFIALYLLYVWETNLMYLFVLMSFLLSVFYSPQLLLKLCQFTLPPSLPPSLPPLSFVPNFIPGSSPSFIFQLFLTTAAKEKGYFESFVL